MPTSPELIILIVQAAQENSGSRSWGRPRYRQRRLCLKQMPSAHPPGTSSMCSGGELREQGNTTSRRRPGRICSKQTSPVQSAALTLVASRAAWTRNSGVEDVRMFRPSCLSGLCHEYVGQNSYQIKENFWQLRACACAVLGTTHLAEWGCSCSESIRPPVPPETLTVGCAPPGRCPVSLETACMS